MLRWRLLLGTVLIAVLVGLFWLDHRAAVPGIALFPLLVLFTWLATGEMLHLERAAGMRPIPWAVYGGNLLLIGVGWAASLVKRPPFAGEPGLWVLLAFCAIVLLIFVAEIQRYQAPGATTANLAAAFLALAYVGVLSTFMILLRIRWGIAGLASLVLVAKLSDTGAYTVGRLIGRTRMAPRLSPGKTVEGAAGGLAFACFGAWLTFTYLAPPPPDAWRWVAFGLIVGLAAMIGDLAESLLKRDAGQKDSSHWMPGFGGVLDIFDSLLVAAPVAYACWAFGLVRDVA